VSGRRRTPSPDKELQDGLDREKKVADDALVGRLCSAAASLRTSASPLHLHARQQHLLIASGAPVWISRICRLRPMPRHDHLIDP